MAAQPIVIVIQAQRPAVDRIALLADRLPTPLIARRQRAARMWRKHLNPDEKLPG